jgi:hypothetical protein
MNVSVRSSPFRETVNAGMTENDGETFLWNVLRRDGAAGMDLRKITLYSFLGFSLAAAAFAIYGWLNVAVSLDHARQQQRTERERSELLREFLVALDRGAKRSEIKQCVMQNFGQGHIIKEEQDDILVDGIVFRFDKTQSLSKIQFLDDMGD